jgi:hypothetical protein
MLQAILQFFNRTIFLFILILIFSNCNQTPYFDFSENDLKFQEYLGKEKSKALNIGIIEFENWLNITFQHDDMNKNYQEFLDHVYNNYRFDTTLNYRSACSEKTKALIHSSGLFDEMFKLMEYEVITDSLNHRQELRLIGTSEEEMMIQIFQNGVILDSLNEEDKIDLSFQLFRKYFKGLKTFSSDSVNSIYIELKESNRTPPPAIIASIFRKANVNYENYLTRVILFQEFAPYYHLRTVKNYIK